MKKLTLLTAVFIISLMSVNAQRFGIKAGLNLSGINTDTELAEMQTEDLLAGLNGGFVFELNPFEHVGFRAEALFSQKGYSLTTDADIDGTDIVTDYSLNMDYLEIPVLMKFKFGPAYFTAGPYFAYAVSGDEIISMTIDGEELAESQIEEQGAIPSNDIFKDGEFNGDNINFDRTDFGIQAGAGIEFMKFFAELRYAAGLTDIDKDKGLTEDDFTKNYTISITAGILFGK
ncbi:MAG: PorT family protein [Chlorobi bacterium]|nr:PorT family protein [Chlorobiota bacterium]